ncbi:F-actin-capping protein subunit alpha [Dipodascopsis uninucleata]
MSTQAKIKAASEFLSDAPPGEVKDVYEDIKAIVEDDDDVVTGLGNAFQVYNTAQFTTVRVPSSSKAVIISKYNCIGPGKFFDSEIGKSFSVDYMSLQVSDVEDHESLSDNFSSIAKDMSAYVSEHYPDPSAYGVYPQSSTDDVALVIVGNKYSPSNFWNGRWRSSYKVNLSSGLIEGTIEIDVHYYEDGNVRLTTLKDIKTDFTISNIGSIVKSIASAERSYQEQVNREFGGLSDGAFKALRRQLPVTRSKIEWGKSIGTYRLGQDIGGGRANTK